nr:hypothetical protein [Clostridia bacterium]
MLKKLLAIVLLLCMAATSASAVTYTTPDGRSVMLALGGSFVYARDTNDALRVWGDNQFGQLGRGNASQSYKIREFTTKSPTLDVSMLTDIITGSDFSFMWMEDGTIWGAGNNAYLPIAARGSFWSTHQKVDLPVKPAALAPGFGHVLLLTEDGDVYSWGRGSEYQLGTGSRKKTHTPARVGVENIVQIAAGGKFSLALDADGQLWGWGDNEFHQLSPAEKTPFVKTPIRIDTGDIDIAYIDACGGSVVLLDTQGTLWTWGCNTHHQLGYDTKGQSVSAPRAVPLPLPVKYVAAYSSQTYAILEDGSLWSWGNNSYGQLGQGFRSASSVGVLPGKCWDSDVVLVQGGSLFCIAMLEDGTLLSAGISKFGQLGEGDAKSKYSLSPNGIDLIPD